MLSQAKEAEDFGNNQNLERGRKDSFPEPSEGAGPC